MSNGDKCLCLSFKPTKGGRPLEVPNWVKPGTTFWFTQKGIMQNGNGLGSLFRIEKILLAGQPGSEMVSQDSLLVTQLRNPDSGTSFLMSLKEVIQHAKHPLPKDHQPPPPKRSRFDLIMESE